MTLKTWVVGSGGLVGSAITRRSAIDAFAAARIPWGTDRAAHVLGTELDRFVDWIADDDWGIVWAAGAGFMSTTQDSLDIELELFESFCDRLPSAMPRGKGGFYLVSSAGGMYAGSSNPPFGPKTTPKPLNAYGRMKAAQEHRVIETLSPRLPVTIGRVANAYGPGQDLFKQQGLITQLSLSALLNRPATIFAPLPTLRDYIYVDDAARFVSADIHRMTGAQPGVIRRVIGSGRAASISELIAIVEHTSGRTFPIMHRMDDGPFFLDLRLESSDQVGVAGQGTPLETGVALVYRDLQRQLADGRLVALV